MISPLSVNKQKKILKTNASIPIREFVLDEEYVAMVKKLSRKNKIHTIDDLVKVMNGIAWRKSFFNAVYDYENYQNLYEMDGIKFSFENEEYSIFFT